MKFTQVPWLQVIKGLLPLVMAAIASASATAQTSPPQLWFNDDFIDLTTTSSLWQTTYLLNGARWYAENDTNTATVWNESTSPPPSNLARWMDYTGSLGPIATYAYGGLTLSSPDCNFFPYFWAGPPFETALFPSTSQGFTLTCAVQFSTISVNGDGFLAYAATDTTPDLNPADEANFLNAPIPNDPSNEWGPTISPVPVFAVQAVSQGYKSPSISFQGPGLPAIVYTKSSPAPFNIVSSAQNIFKVIGTVSGGLANYDYWLYTTADNNWHHLGTGENQPLSTWPNSMSVGNPIADASIGGPGPWTTMLLDYVRITTP
jgi:hypothetical protein